MAYGYAPPQQGWAGSTRPGTVSGGVRGGGGGGGNPFSGIFGGGGGSNDPSTVSQNSPWNAISGPLKKLINKTGNYFENKRGFNAPDFQTWVPMADQTTQALSQIQDLAGQGNPLAGQSVEALQGIIGSDPFSPEFRRMVDTQAGQLGDDITRQFGGSAFGGADHTGALVRGIGDFRDRAYAGQYNQGIANTLSGIQAAPGAYEQQYAGANKLAGVGSAYQDEATRQLQARLDKFNTRDMAPWNRAGSYLGILNGAGGQYGTSTTTAQAPSNPFGGALGGALGGYQLGNQMFPGMGGVPGAVVGGLGGWLANR
jgi:hypothetical protein